MIELQTSLRVHLSMALIMYVFLSLSFLVTSTARVGVLKYELSTSIYTVSTCAH